MHIPIHTHKHFDKRLKFSLVAARGALQACRQYNILSAEGLQAYGGVKVWKVIHERKTREEKFNLVSKQQKGMLNEMIR